ncbi:hypothetical protein NRF20_42145 [Streptomyces sp. R-74717]|uniref:MmyB family transcriptional regulator n=1 Tax=Streptomyces sp. R-74717 TaxID=2969820 RepID=UPI0039B634DC
MAYRPDQRRHRSADVGGCPLRHPAVGDLTLAFEVLPVPTDPGLTLTALSAEPGTASDDRLKLLASWAAALDQSGRPNTRITSGEHTTHQP